MVSKTREEAKTTRAAKASRKGSGLGRAVRERRTCMAGFSEL
jgi:hypothetical protein